MTNSFSPLSESSTHRRSPGRPQDSASVRRALLGRFPYAVYYQVDRDVSDVVGCPDTRQSPEVWDTRQSEV